MNDIKNLLREYEEDNNKKYDDKWVAEAVNALNERYLDTGYDDSYIYDTNSDEFEDLVKYNLESRGWQGVEYFLGNVELMTNYAQVDAYGNAKSVDYDIVDLLQSEVDEADEADEADEDEDEA